MKQGVQEHIAVLGAGSWGTAIALALAHKGHRVLLWGRDKTQIQDIQASGVNKKYLPDAPFPKNLDVTASLSDALKLPNLLISVPSHAFAGLLNEIPQLPSLGVAWLTKGLEPTHNRLLSDMIVERFGPSAMAMISGPSFAKEVAAQKPTALVVASNQLKIGQHWQSLLHSSINRVYTSTDLLGVQLCGAVKNVLAIACGISDGLAFGANSRAALITRGIAEMTQLGLKMGADAETFHGLAGLGDLVLTCTDNQSRNRRFGLLIGEEYTTEQACAEIKQVVEGLHNAKQVFELSQTYKIEMPISEAVHLILSGKLTAKQAAENLLSRPILV
jgi:glycerol-3-phosphate dehydrogenase (NAD(P)+)